MILIEKNAEAAGASERSKANQEMERRIRNAKRTNHIMTGVFWGIGGFFLILVLVLAAYIIISGLMDYYPGILGTGRNGIANQLFNTIYLVALSLLVSVPIGVCSGIYMAEYAKDNGMTHFLRICIESLSSLPSIVIGLFGYIVFILMTGLRWNLLAGALAVSILSIPSITTTTEDALRALPPGYLAGALALGDTRWHAIRKVLLPACLPRIITGVILAAGRGFGEAAALLYTAGQSTRINWTDWNLTSSACPLNPMRPGETLALHIWVMRTEGALNPNSDKIAGFSAAILVIVVLTFSLIARMITRRVSRKQTGESK